MSDLSDRNTPEELEALAIRMGADPSGMPSGDVRSNFPMFGEIKGSDAYQKALSEAARDLYGMLKRDRLIQAHFGKPVHLAGREQGRISNFSQRTASKHCYALELLLHSLAFALSAPLVKDGEGKVVRKDFVAIPLDNNAFSKGSYESLNREAFRIIVYALTIYDPEKRERPWLEFREPFFNPEIGVGKRTCVRADTPFQEWIFSKGLIFPYHPKGLAPANATAGKKARQSPLWVSCKSKDEGGEAHYEPLYRPLEGEEVVLPNINAALNRQRVSCRFTSYAEYKKYDDYKKGRPRAVLGGNKRLYRQFSEKDGRGGRLYGHWVQILPSELRERLTINKSAVSELDFGSMQLVLLYHLADAPVPGGDLYAQSGMTSSRSDMKMVLTLSVGNATEQETLGAIRVRLKDEGRLKEGRAERLYDEFWSHHGVANPHQQGRQEGAWIELQRLDSLITLRILGRLLDLGITAIPVHDSFIVKRCHAEITKSMMLEVFAEYCPGTEVQVRVTGTGA